MRYLGLVFTTVTVCSLFGALMLMWITSGVSAFRYLVTGAAVQRSLELIGEPEKRVIVRVGREALRVVRSSLSPFGSFALIRDTDEQWQIHQIKLLSAMDDEAKRADNYRIAATALREFSHSEPLTAFDWVGEEAEGLAQQAATGYLIDIQSAQAVAEIRTAVRDSYRGTFKLLYRTAVARQFRERVVFPIARRLIAAIGSGAALGFIVSNFGSSGNSVGSRVKL